MQNTLGPVSVAALQRYPAVKCDNCIWEKIISRYRGGQCSSFWSQLFWYVAAEKERLFFANFASMLATTSGNTSEIWGLSCVFSKWSWKTEYYCFWYKLTKKRKRYHIWRSHVTMAKKNCWYGNVTRQWLKTKRCETTVSSSKIVLVLP